MKCDILLRVLGRLVALEPAKAALLDDILVEKIIDHSDLVERGALAAPAATNGN